MAVFLEQPVAFIASSLSSSNMRPTEVGIEKSQARTYILPKSVNAVAHHGSVNHIILSVDEEKEASHNRILLVNEAIPLLRQERE